MFIESFGVKKLFKPVEDISKVTVVVPTYNGEDTIGITIEDLLLKFDKDKIVIVSNGSIDNTISIASSYGVVVVEITEPVGKVWAINYGLDNVKTPYVLIMDDDTLVSNAIIPTNALDQGYEGVAFRVLPIIQGPLTVLQTYEYRKSMDIARTYHNKTATVQSISGAIGLFHTKELVRQINLHTGEFSGEDLQRTLLIHIGIENKGVVIADSTVVTYVPNTLKDLFKQRIFGWNPGFLANFGIYIKILFKKSTPIQMKYEAFYSVVLVTLGDILRVISLPVLLFSPAYIIVFYITYIFLETIPWYRLGRKDPYWTVLISPIYGLFNFIARILANGVFMYRRMSYFFGKGKKYDDYRQAGKATRLVSVTVSLLLLFLLIMGYCYIVIIPYQYQPVHLFQ